MTWERRDAPGDAVELHVLAPAPGERLLVVRGEIDAAEADAVQEVATRLLAEASSLVVDLSELGFLASRGLAALVHVQRAAERAGVSLQVVTGGNRAVLRPLQVTGVDTQLHLVAHRDGPAPG
ncbi:STAS domain-containing protein [Pseudonocardia ailaonensis]|uniref:STAS domain-containing protein n=1 Tax=Pseudonocardia ailaonensis TaxID=367279 RepID=UPI0031E30D98